MNQKKANEVRVSNDCNHGKATDSILLDAKSLKSFAFNGAEFRAVLENGEPLFVANDVCEVLGYENPRKTVGDHCAHVTKRYVSYPSGSKETNFLPESDLYRLIFRSKKPEAKAFADYVYEVVLPAIRKTGEYSGNQTSRVQDAEAQAAALRQAEEQKQEALLRAHEIIKDAAMDFQAVVVSCGMSVVFPIKYKTNDGVVYDLKPKSQLQTQRRSYP